MMSTQAHLIHMNNLPSECLQFEAHLQTRPEYFSKHERRTQAGFQLGNMNRQGISACVSCLKVITLYWHPPVGLMEELSETTRRTPAVLCLSPTRTKQNWNVLRYAWLPFAVLSVWAGCRRCTDQRDTGRSSLLGKRRQRKHCPDKMWSDCCNLRLVFQINIHWPLEKVRASGV